MTNLINIENKDGQLLTKVKIGGHLLDYIDLYEMVCEMSYKVHEHGLDNLLGLLHLAKSITPKEKNIPFLENSARETIFRNYQSSLPTEFDIHKLVQKNISKVIDNCAVFERINDAKHQPDVWIRANGYEIPVEVKLKNFDYKALKQLKRYMDFYNCKKGIAVASELTTILPKSIKFIAIKELEG